MAGFLVHQLVKLNRGFCAHEFTLDELFAQIQDNAPGLIIEAQDEKPVSPSPRASSSIVDINIEPAIIHPAAPPKAVEKEVEQVLKKTEWMSKETKESSYPYDDYGSLKPIY